MFGSKRRVEFRAGCLLAVSWGLFAFACSGDSAGSDPCAHTAADQRCVGAPLPCETLDLETCSKTPGCSTDTPCTGDTSACGLSMMDTCLTRPGCAWSMAQNVCAGYSTPCARLTDDCLKQPGCTKSCGGTPRACISLTPSECTRQPGCSIGYAEKPGCGGGCRGVALTCTALSQVSCSGSLGCIASGSCEGASDLCSSFASSTGCTAQRGCTWSTFDNACSGVAASCFTLPDEISCTRVTGCRWNFECKGSALPCSLLTSTQCASQLGCYAK